MRVTIRSDARQLPFLYPAYSMRVDGVRVGRFRMGQQVAVVLPEDAEEISVSSFLGSSTRRLVTHLREGDVLKFDIVSDGQSGFGYFLVVFGLACIASVFGALATENLPVAIIGTIVLLAGWLWFAFKSASRAMRLERVQVRNAEEGNG